MDTPREALGKRRASSGHRHRAELEDDAMAAANMQIPEVDEKPDCIIGGYWPSRVVGARRSLCQDCAGFIALSPSSGLAATERWPDLPVICFDCATKRADVARDK